MEMYIKLAAKLRDRDRILQIYKSAKQGRISLLYGDYHKYLQSFSKEPEIFNRLVGEVWEDMANDEIQPRAGTFKEILKAAVVQGDIPAAIETFRLLETR
jgi:hypothetical protein